jgi:CheY-like chemotaxis protein
MDACHDLLNTWKEIARYLDRGVRTVQRWEAELGLPVRRPRGKDRSAVIAFRAEVDEWLRTRPIADRERVAQDSGFAWKKTPHQPPRGGTVETQLADAILEARCLRAKLRSLRSEVSKASHSLLDVCQKIRPATSVGSSRQEELLASTYRVMTQGMPPKILVVDDNEIQSYVLAKTLQSAGFAVNSALSGHMALAMMKESKPDAVVLDVNMPVMNGFEVCSRIKEDPQNRDLPVIFYTSGGADGKAYAAESLGAKAFLTYPINPEHLTRVISTSIAKLSARIGTPNG